MKNRNIPCTECRKHRRKCIRTSSDICARCERLGKLCIQPTQTTLQQSDNEDPGVDDLQNQVEQLEWAIRQMEDQMKSLSCRSSNETSLARLNKSPMFEEMIKNLMYSWQFQIKNGTFQIETGIRNISDLLPFQYNTSIPYLSPISSSSSNSSISSYSTGSEYDFNDDIYRGNESGLMIRFGQNSEGTIPFTVRVLTKCANEEYLDPTTLSLPSALLFDSFSIVDQLIDIYFRCQNVYQPMVHKPTFMKNYRQLKDPLNDLLSVSICCYVCSSTCRHFHFSKQDRKNMADYFHSKAKALILDQFDDPDKRLENVIAINLLSRHLHMTLRINECKRLIKMAYQIITDLKNDYGSSRFTEYSKSNFDESDYAMRPLTEVSSDVNHVLFTRHVTVTLCVRRLMDFVTNTAVDDTSFHFPVWLYLEDEPQLCVEFVQAQNWVLAFFNHPFIAKMMIEIHKVHVGLVCTLPFESIVRLEDIINEWSATMPDKFRLCADMKNEELCVASIQQTTDFLKLISFVHFHLFLVGIYSCLLQPIALGTESEQLLSYVQQQSLANTLKSCRLLIHAVHRMSSAEGQTSCHYKIAAREFLYHAIDVLLLLSLSPNYQVAKETRIILKQCLSQIDSLEFMQEHRVAKNESPIHLGLIDINDTTTFNLLFYEQYPQPWFAMMYDTSHYIASLQL